jgi:FtsP/CotA-like multicopper oxidase with cupredoxin domain
MQCSRNYRVLTVEKLTNLLKATIATKSVRAVLLLFAVPAACWAQNPCPRHPLGSAVTDPPAVFSNAGKLTVDLMYLTGTDNVGNTTFCFKMLDGRESPTLYLNPGDELSLRVTNLVPPDAPGLPQMKMPAGMDVTPADDSSAKRCGASTMTNSSVNVHYHGTNVSPTCHSDEVIHTLINSGQSFEYRIKFPADEPAGLYFYHPHVHGLSEAAVQGGATGLIVIRGIENVQPAVAGLPQRLLIVRDYPMPEELQPPAPEANVSLNYISVPYPAYPPAVIHAKPLERQFWRVANTSADTILDIELNYDGTPQPLHLVALDGVATGSQDGTRLGKIVRVKHLLIPTAGRAEFIMTTPGPEVGKAVFFTRYINTGKVGDSDPTRPLAVIDVRGSQGDEGLQTIPAFQHMSGRQRFEGLAEAPVTAKRKLYFSEKNEESQFFITVEGQKPKLFDPNNPPAIVTHQGAVEEWTIENRAEERHEFHIHQIHFLVMAENGVGVSQSRRQFLDTVDVPAWSGKGPYPSVTVRMDFRGPDIGDFVYHCHILEHEDGGMMATIRVLPKKK